MRRISRVRESLCNFGFISETNIASLDICEAGDSCHRKSNFSCHKKSMAAYHKFFKDRTEVLSGRDTKSKVNERRVSPLKAALLYLDADFFNDNEVRDMAEGAKEFNIPTFRVNRRLVASEDGGLQNPSVLVFNSSWGSHYGPYESENFKYPSLSNVRRPSREDDIAFMTVLELAALIRTKQITSHELTDIFMRRLKKYNNVLEAVITFTEDLAYSQAKAADELLEKGVYLVCLDGSFCSRQPLLENIKLQKGVLLYKNDTILDIPQNRHAILLLLERDIILQILTAGFAGPLHGIPYGLKDIIAVPHYKTTWGSRTFKDQVLDIEAWVYKRLKASGAVLLAKLVTGSLAYDDIWFGGRTRNPWNIEEFSTGSSAGPAASTSAGLVPFAIGSETAGSMTYPAARCGITCLRPTFGTVGRTGVMSISESLDKLGPFCRSAMDCATIIDTIRGKDPNDLSSRNIFFEDPFSIDIKKLTVGYLEDAEMEVVDVLKSKGVKVVPFKLNYTVVSVQSILNFTMDVDMLSHFDHWQRSGEDAQYEAQDQWPEELRRARLIPAVDYLQAQRARGKLLREVRESFTVDAFVGNATDWELVCLGNLVGMPVVVVPTGFKSIEDPPKHGTARRRTITTGIYAPPDRDHIALALAMAYQSVTDHHKQRPPIDTDLGSSDVILALGKTR